MYFFILVNSHSAILSFHVLSANQIALQSLTNNWLYRFVIYKLGRSSNFYQSSIHYTETHMDTSEIV